MKRFCKSLTVYTVAFVVCKIPEALYLFLWYLRLTTGVSFLDTLSQCRYTVVDIVSIIGIFVLEFWAATVARPELPLEW